MASFSEFGWFIPSGSIVAGTVSDQTQASNSVVVASTLAHESPQAAGAHAGQPEVKAEATQAELESLWEYADDRGKIQGPFSAQKIREWLRQGALKPNRRVRPHDWADNIDFEPMESLPLFANVISAELPPPPPMQPGLGGSGGAHVETPFWMYEDAQGAEQGPFAATQMQQWLQHGYLPPTTRVRHARDTSGAYKLLGAVPQLGGRVAAPLAEPSSTDEASESIADALDRSLAAQRAAGGFQEYMAVGTWVNGRFVPADRAGDAHFTAKGLAPDRAGRQMQHYFDHDRWQDEMNARKAAGKLGKKRALPA